MIPVLGVPVLNRYELLQRFFNTIDYGPIDRLFIIDNGGNLDPSVVNWPTHVNRIHVANPGYNTGVAGGWNMIIRANIHADWWIICNNDMQLEPGVLAKVVDAMHTDKPTICRIASGNEDWGNHYGAFALNGELVDTVGWFDENLLPIYFEDTDHMRRMERLPAGTFQNILIKSSSFHDGNQSWKGNADLSNMNKRSWDANVAYFDDKWAGVDKGERSVIQWTAPTVRRIRSQDWVIHRKDNVK